MESQLHKDGLSEYSSSRRVRGKMRNKTDLGTLGSRKHIPNDLTGLVTVFVFVF